MKLNPKMGFWRAKQGLSKHGILKTKIGLICGKKNVEKKGRRGRRREEEEEGGFKPRSSYGMELTLDMNSIMDHMDFVWNSRKDYEFQT